MSSTCLAPPVAQVVKILQAHEGDIRDSGLDPWVRKAPWSRKWQPTPVFWPVNPMDRGVWWATGHRVTKSQTRLKRLSTGVCLPVQEHIVTIHGKIFISLLVYCMWVCAPSLCCVWLFATPWSVDCQALLFMEFSYKNTRASCHFLLQGNLPDPGIKPASLVFPVLAGRFFTTEPSGKTLLTVWVLSTPPLQCGSERKIILSWTVKSLSSYPTSKLKCKPKYWQKM